MNKYVLIIGALLLFAAHLVKGQSFEYGTGFHGTTVKEVDENQSPINNDLGLNRAWDFMVGGNFPIINFTDELTVNSYTQLHGGLFSYFEGKAFEALLFTHIPTFISLNYGAGSNKNSIIPFGLGAGIGYSFTGYLGEVDRSYEDSQYFLTYFAPVVMFQIAFDFGRSDKFFDNVKICLEKDLTKTYFQYTDQSTNNTVHESFSQFNLSLIFFNDHR